MPIAPLLKLSSLAFLAGLSACLKNPRQAVAIKIGPSAWTFQEAKDYFQMRLRGGFLGEPSGLKKELLNEIFLISLVENWARQNKIKSERAFLTAEEKKSFKSLALRLALKRRKSYLSLYGRLLKELSKKAPQPPLKEQKKFYKDNKKRFLKPPACRLKQIAVDSERLALSLKKRLEQGEAFDRLQKLYSLKKNPGWAKKGALDVFDRACFGPKEAENQIFKSPFGWHIFLVEGKRPGKQISFKAARGRIIQLLKNKKAKDLFQGWLKEEAFKSPLWADQKLLNKILIQYKNSGI